MDPAEQDGGVPREAPMVHCGSDEVKQEGEVPDSGVLCCRGGPRGRGHACRVEAHKNTQGLPQDWLRPEWIFLEVGMGVPWDNVPSLIHVTDAIGVAGILKVGMVRTMGRAMGALR